MEVGYDKAALQEYMDKIGNLSEEMRRHQDESLNLYNSCKQQYNRIHTKLEEVAHRAYNQVENAESMRRSAELEYETARRTAENAEDEDEKNAAMQGMRQAQMMRAEADEEYSKASIAYSKASGDLINLSELWGGSAPALESQAHRAEDDMASFSRLVTNGDSDLCEYMSIMDKAQVALHGDSGEGTSSNGGSASFGSTTNAAGKQSSKSNNAQRTTGLSFKSKLGNTVGITAAVNGLKTISMSFGGKSQTLLGTKSGIAKAHRSALKSGDTELASYTSQMFSSAVLTNDLGAEKADDNGNVYTDENGVLRPNTEYVLNGNVYKTDENGRIIDCESIPKKTPENIRDTDTQTTVGGEDRRPGDQGGHIIGRDMGGDGGLGNLIPMDSRINQSDYKRMENEIKRALEERKDVSTKSEIEYDGNSDRPSKITTTVTIDGKDTVYTFDNELDGSLMDKLNYRLLKQAG